MTLTPGSTEWIAERRSGIGGTDVPKILGVSRFGSAMDCYLDKRGLTAPLIQNDAMRWGTILEEPVAAEYAIQTGRKVRRAAGFIRRPGYDWAYANIDRWSLKAGTPKRVLEVKTAGVFATKDFGEPGSDQVPADYLLQVMHYIACTGVDTADLAVLIGGQRFEVYTVERDDELIEGMTEICAKFWSDTSQGIPPEIDGSEGTALYLASKYRDTGTERPMDEVLALLATQYAALKAEEKARKEEIDIVGNRIRDAMGNDRWSEGHGVRVVYSAVAGRTTVNWEGFLKAKDIPASAVEPFKKIGEPGRSLTVTMKGDI